MTDPEALLEQVLALTKRRIDTLSTRKRLSLDEDTVVQGYLRALSSLVRTDGRRGDPDVDDTPALVAKIAGDPVLMDLLDRAR